MDLYGQFKKDLFPEPCTETEALQLFRVLESRYQGPDRYYHTLHGHVQYALNVFAYVTHGALCPSGIRVALYFHDEDPDENESAEFAVNCLRDIGTPECFCKTVRRRIIATKHTGDLEDLDDQIIADVDLAALGADWKKFKMDSYDLRSEDRARGVSDSDSQTHKVAFLKKLLGRKTIYYGKPFQWLFESRARENIERALKELYA